MKIAAVILAAGQGTRMRSNIPKVLHPLAGKPMIDYSLEAVQSVTGQAPLVVIGHGAEAVEQAIGDRARCVVQQPQLGTAHAVQTAAPLLQGSCDLLLVTAADMPLISPQTYQRLIETQKNNTGALTMLSVELADPHGFGRVVRNADGTVKCIVEEAQATPDQLTIRELNTAIYCFDAEWLWSALSQIKVSPKGEYYLTDAIGIATDAGLTVQAIRLENPEEAIGINTRAHLAEAEAVLRRRINLRWMLEGVTIVDPATTYIEADVQIGQDTVIWPNTYLRGKTVIGQNCVVGPNTMIEDCQIGDDCTILATVMEQAVVENHVEIGPYGHLRKGAHLAEGVHMGNFGEVKNSYLGPGVKMGHFSYIGDATIGKDVNIGAGTITCNFDGVRKHRTVIGENTFIGSDTMLVAPLTIGANAKTGAGAVVTHDVPDNTVVVGVPARPLRKTSQEKDPQQDGKQ
jgi:bifunctional UDP-N-acetylglucosamine pyrophosphorylase/glucosamine-1-phosphate N-acetyltransferase